MSVARTDVYGSTAALISENDRLRVVVLPERGSKMASLFYKPRGAELLWQSPGQAYPPAAYAATYDENHGTGFDEMFPNISRCHYERFPWAGVEMPDHGEVWSIPWSWTIEQETVCLEVHGVRFPYRLRKRINLEPSAVRLDYEATNLSGFDFDFLWAAHPLFHAAPGMEVVVPPGADRIVNAVPSSRLKEYGRAWSFPLDRLPDGTAMDLSRVPEKNAGGFQKYYFLGPLSEGWCELRNPATGIDIRLSFPCEQVPYLGMWVNEGGWCGHYNIAPEPCTGAMDRIDAARLWNMNSVLRGGETKRWQLRIAVEESIAAPDPRN